jgi:hypothetical protein
MQDFPHFITSTTYQPTYTPTRWFNTPTAPDSANPELSFNWKNNASSLSCSSTFYRDSGGIESQTLSIPLSSLCQYFIQSVLALDETTYASNPRVYDNLFEKYLVDYASRYLLTAEFSFYGAANSVQDSLTYYNPAQCQYINPNDLIPQTGAPINIPSNATTTVSIEDFGSQGLNTSNSVLFKRYQLSNSLDTFKEYLDKIGGPEEPGPHGVIRTARSNPYSYLAANVTSTMAQNELNAAADLWKSPNLTANLEEIKRRSLDPLRYLLHFFMRLFKEIAQAAQLAGEATKQLQQALEDAQNYSSIMHNRGAQLGSSETAEAQDIAYWEGQANSTTSSMRQIQSRYDSSKSDAEDMVSAISTLSDLQKSMLSLFQEVRKNLAN